MLILRKIGNVFELMFKVLFPDLCLACSMRPKSKTTIFCSHCLTSLPLTDHFEVKMNTVKMHLAGRVPLHHGAALLTFRKEGIVQHILHQLKYKNRPVIGKVMGKMAASKLEQSVLFEKPDIVIPVPIHPNKIKKRGYNQSTVFGHSLGKAIHVPCDDTILIKIIENPSQTGKSRTERVDNVAGGFKVVRTSAILNKHILVVDDVITTGATIEACCNILLDAGAGKISVLCIAAAES